MSNNDVGVREAINRTAARHPFWLCAAVFLGCAIDALVVLGVKVL